jgi:UDP-N-acetylglucosamine--N-acetylmuramyl-(pentapeptide) pyrophosphoryl-undecaprenol N-acetylglucosamine transferase
MIAGGGTGGHIYPGIAVAEELRRLDPKAKFLFVGSDRGLEGKVVPAAGFDLATIPARGVVRTKWWRLPMAAWGNLIACFKALNLVRDFQPDVVLGTGGYVSMPVGLAAWLMHKPLILQEQNSVPGLANRVLSKFAEEVHLAFTEARRYLWRRDRLKLTGNPVRRMILSGNRRSARARFGLDEKMLTVFIFGGSRGARRITEAALDAMRRLKGSIEAQYILQTGKEDFSQAKQETDSIGVRAVVFPFVTEIHEAYAAADVVVSRAGAMTLAEIAASGVPAILVPFPHAAYDHQVKNAQSLTERGAATMILDQELSGERLAQELLALLRDRETLVRFSAHARTFARPDAAERIARSLLSRDPERPATDDTDKRDNRRSRGN